MRVYINKDVRSIKNELRSKYRKIKEEMDPKKKKSLDAQIQIQLLSLSEYVTSKKIFIYISKDFEIDTVPVIRAALSEGKLVATPRCIEGTNEMMFHMVNSRDDVLPGFFGVLEPNEKTCPVIEDFSDGICIVPGFCFDNAGYRIGFGKGYYDRFLSNFKGITLGLCYSQCVVNQLPRNKFDRPVDFLVTDKYVCKTKIL